ncbi:MAG: transporter associated domain-containing protein [Pseudomonadota bacterium]|nr:transporter associated domain-containing protein [Pseudomonadota bacterium]
MNLVASIKSFFQKNKNDSEGFYSLIRSDKWSSLLGKDQIKMIEGVIEVSSLQVRDIMIPRSNMILLEDDMNIDQMLQIIINSGHSRFPVIGDNKDEVIGILLAKDLLRFSQTNKADFDLNNCLRTATFIPESKQLQILLKEFRKSRNHMAIVVDEYGRTAGLLTIEDVLEQIVGDIEDEYDPEDLPMIQEIGHKKYIVEALIRIEDFNEYFETEFLDEDYDTLGGMLIKMQGKLPTIEEIIKIEDCSFRILEADDRRLSSIEVTLD